MFGITIDPVWLIPFAIFWVAPSIVSGLISSNKGRSFLGCFLLAFCFGPIIGLIVSLLLKGE